MMETTTGCLEIHPVSHITALNTILEKQLMWLHSTTKRTELDNGTHVKNILTDTWASMILSGCIIFRILHQSLGKWNGTVDC